MKNVKKIVALLLCAVLLVGATIAGTVAYLTDSETVKNTFTVGNVTITMDEAKVDEYGVEVEGADRVLTNAYLLVPGHEYVKDPIVHVQANSETCFVYVKITNGISNYIDVADLEAQLSANGWALLDGYTDVWYQLHNKMATADDLEVFENFTVLTNADSVSGWAEIKSGTNDIVVTAYAIQADTFYGDEVAAWNALTAQLNPPANP